jgi:hypothetical protein
MSKTFTLGILVVLLALLGVMSYAIRTATQPPPPPSPEETAKAEKQRVEMQKEMVKKEAQQRKEMMEAMARRKKEEKKSPPKPGTGSMEITSDWFKKREPGQVGIEKASKAAERYTPPSAMPSSVMSAPPSVRGDAGGTTQPAGN